MPPSQFYTVAQLVAATQHPQSLVLQTLQQSGAIPTTDGLTGQTCYLEEDALRAFTPKVLDSYRLRQALEVGCPAPLLSSNAATPERFGTPKFLALRSAADILPIGRDDKMKTGWLEKEDGVVVNPGLRVTNMTQLRRILVAGSYTVQTAAKGTACYIDLRELMDLDAWASPAERIWKRAASHWHVLASQQAKVYNAKKPTPWVPKAPQAKSPKHKALAIVKLGAESCAFDPRQPQPQALVQEGIELRVQGTKETWTKWVPTDYLQGAVDLANRYYDVLREERLGLRRGLLNVDVMTPNERLAAAVFPEPLKSETVHREEYAKMLLDWERDAPAWRASILQQILPDDFRLVF